MNPSRSRYTMLVLLYVLFILGLFGLTAGAERAAPGGLPAAPAAQLTTAGLAGVGSELPVVVARPLRRVLGWMGHRPENGEPAGAGCTDQKEPCPSQPCHNAPPTPSLP